MKNPKPLPRPETCMFYGNSGSGKTTLLVFLAKWMYETYGLTTRLISADLGGWAPVEKEELIKVGIVEAFNVSSRPNLLADTRKLSRGWWPALVKEQREVEQPDGSFTAKEVTVRRICENKAKLEKVGLYFVEGATSLSTAFLRHITKQSEVKEVDNGKGGTRSKTVDIGSEGAVGRYEEDGEVFGANSRGHFNIVQTEMHGLFAAFSSLPSPVRLVCWTGHVGKGTLKRTGESCYAPQLAGDAKNSEVPSWVGDCFHLEDTPEVVDENGATVQQKEVRAYYVNHPDKDTQVNYLCKSRVGPSDVENLKERFPGGYIPLGLERGANIDGYFQWLEERQGANLKSLMEWKEKVDKANAGNT